VRIEWVKQPKIPRRAETSTVPELQVIARHTTVDGMRDAVFAILPKLIEASRNEPGNLACDEASPS
jgi:hypothetical protein